MNENLAEKTLNFHEMELDDRILKVFHLQLNI